MPLAVDATLMDTVDYGCSSREKTCASSKSESLTTFVSGTYSRKVFIGGLPPDLDAGMLHVRVLCVWCVCVCGVCCTCVQMHWLHAAMSGACLPRLFHLCGPVPAPCMHADDIQRHFAWCGALQVDWPYRTKSRALFPPKGDWTCLHTLFT